MSETKNQRPLAGVRIVERSRGIAAAYAGHLLTALGAQTVMFEDAKGSPLRHMPPLLAGASTPDPTSALFAYLSAGKRSLACDLLKPQGQSLLDAELVNADILIDDTALAERASHGLTQARIATRHPHLVHVSVLPFGADGEKASWCGEEINLVHAGGEGFLLPNGLAQSLFPDRPPLKIFGNFASYQGGASSAMAALAALWMAPESGGQYVDASVQDAMVAVGAFAIQRLGDGSLEHRASRSFRYGGVFETRDGFVQLLMLEDRQWNGFVEVMGNPDWACDPDFKNPLERSRRGDEINAHIRDWMRERASDEVVRMSQARGVPTAPYLMPSQVLAGEHERARGLFERVSLPSGGDIEVQVAPFHFLHTPLHIDSGVPALGEYQPANSAPNVSGNGHQSAVRERQ